MVRRASFEALGRWRSHEPAQFAAGLPPAPLHRTPHRLGGPHRTRRPPRMDPTAPHRLPTAPPPTPPAPASTHTTTTTRITEQPSPGRGGQPPHKGGSPRTPARPQPTPRGRNPRDHPHDTTRTREPPTARQDNHQCGSTTARPTAAARKPCPTS